MNMNDGHPLQAMTTDQPARTDAAWLDAHWMPYTGNRNFKANPRMVVSAQGAYFTMADGRRILVKKLIRLVKHHGQVAQEGRGSSLVELSAALGDAPAGQEHSP
jgi:uncharacterized protein (DUF2345 family)